MAFIPSIYFYFVLLLFLINPKDSMSRKGVRESNIPSSPFTSTSSSPAISAVLLECPNVQRRSASRPDCERQMMVHIRVSPTFQVETLEKFLLLDEVYDQRRKTRAKLMSPYLIEISRGEPVVMYPLQFTKSIRCDTCGHKNSNSTNTSQANCEHLSNVGPLNSPESHIGSVLQGTAPSEGIQHSSRCVQQEEQHKHQQQQLQQRKQQQQTDDEASMEKGHNPGPKPSTKIESRQKFAIGILDSPPQYEGQSKKPTNANVEEQFHSRDIPFHESDVVGFVVGNVGGVEEEVNMDYDDDEYDELNLNDEALTGQGESVEEFSVLRHRDKRLKTPPSKPTQTQAVTDALLQNEELFREAERQSEEARMDTLRAFKTKHEQPVGAAVGTSGLAPGDGYETVASSWGNEGKPHVVGIHDIRPLRAFDADEIDDVDADVVGKVAGAVGQKHNLRLQSKIVSNKNEQWEEDSPAIQSSRFETAQKGQSNWPDVKNQHETQFSQKGTTSSQRDFTSSSNRDQKAFSSPAQKSFSGNHHPLQQKQQQKQQRLHISDDIKDVSTKRKFPYSSQNSVNSQGYAASCSENRGGGGGSGGSGSVKNDDSDRIDTSVRDSSVIESKGNMASPENRQIAVGGMGDEFYWNTLHYPDSSVYTKYKELGAFDGKKVSETDSDKLHRTLNLSKPRKLSNNGNVSGGVVRKENNDLGSAASNHERNNNYHQTASSRRTTPSTDKRQPLPHPRPRSKKFTDKSAAISRNKMKIRSNDVVSTDGGGVVETSGIYTAKDGIVPAFPLNGYPGYSEIKMIPQYVQPHHPESQYKLLENVPQEYLPHQPPFAKELSDPNLTVNDKINLLEVLSSHDKIKDAILKDLENELDSSVIIYDPSNHDRMPIPASKISKRREKKEIKKRSYVMYDDLTLRDTEEQYDDTDEKKPLDAPFFENVRENDPGVCESCNDNMCSVNGEDCTCDREGRNCKCSPQADKKKIRSVSDAWYSVFNMSAPLQFLTTRVGIYRKRHGAWWKTVPSTTLTSLSGIYASENLSILFSSHVDIYQLRRPLSLQNHKLLVPHNDVKAEQLNPFHAIDPNEVLAIDSTKFDFNKIHDDSDRNNKEDDHSSDGDDSAKRSLCHATSAAERQRQQKRRRSSSHSNSDAVLSVGDLGYFPGNMNLLEQCPSDPTHLCLNMLDDEAPAFTIKIKQPFLENALLYNGEYNVRIASIISDATTKGALQVTVILINEGYEFHEFTICICNCPMTCGAKTIVKKDLAPHVGETVSFLLPLVEKKDTKLYCNVEPTARCLCIWDCDCHCIEDLVSHDEYDVCHKLSDYEEQAAGFIEGGLPNQDLTGWRWFWWRMNYYAFSLLFCMLFLGLLKAVVGAVCLQRIDRCGYDYVQPLQKYDYASRCRRFFINLVFFVVVPFICCCKCFTPNEEDLLMANTEWQCSLIQHSLYEDSSGDGENGGMAWKKPSGPYYDGQNANDNNYDDDEETILSQRIESGRGSGPEDSQSPMLMSEYLLSTCEFDDGEEERDKNFVMQALTQSRESIQMLLKSHYSEDLDPDNPLTTKAADLVRRLVAAQIVYRTFETPLQHVNVPLGQKYSIQGYFVPSLGPGYQFITPNPLWQLRRITTGNMSVILQPPNALRAKDFYRAYSSKLEVFEAGDLSVDPPLDSPCINNPNTTNDSQLTTVLTLQQASSSKLRPPLAMGTPPPVGRSLPRANDVVREHEPATANDTITRSDRVDDANNGSNLKAKQKDLARGSQ